MNFWKPVIENSSYTPYPKVIHQIYSYEAIFYQFYYFLLLNYYV